MKTLVRLCYAKLQVFNDKYLSERYFSQRANEPHILMEMVTASTGHNEKIERLERLKNIGRFFPTFFTHVFEQFNFSLFSKLKS